MMPCARLCSQEQGRPAEEARGARADGEACGSLTSVPGRAAPAQGELKEQTRVVGTGFGARALLGTSAAPCPTGSREKGFVSFGSIPLVREGEEGAFPSGVRLLWAPLPRPDLRGKASSFFH